MDLVLFKKIPERFKQMVEEFKDSTLDFWFWRLSIKKAAIIRLYAKKYLREIKDDIFTDAKKIKIEIALFLSEVNEKKLKRELKQEIDKIKQTINRELDDIQIFFDKAVKTKKTEFIYEKHFKINL